MKPRLSRSIWILRLNWRRRCSRNFTIAENGGFWQSAAGLEGFDPAREGRLRRRGAFGKFRCHLVAAETWRNHRQKKFHGSRRKNVAAVLPRDCKIFRRRCRSCCTRWIFRCKSRSALSSPETPDSTNFHELLRAAHSVYQPNKIVLGNAGAVEEFAKTLPAKNEAMVYLCAGNSCQPPTNSAEQLKEMLR